MDLDKIWTIEGVHYEQYGFVETALGIRYRLIEDIVTGEKYKWRIGGFPEKI